MSLVSSSEGLEAPPTLHPSNSKPAIADYTFHHGRSSSFTITIIVILRAFVEPSGTSREKIIEPTKIWPIMFCNGGGFKDALFLPQNFEGDDPI